MLTSRPAFLYLTYLIFEANDLILKQTKIFNDNLVNNIEDSLNTGYQVLGLNRPLMILWGFKKVLFNLCSVSFIKFFCNILILLLLFKNNKCKNSEL